MSSNRRAAAGPWPALQATIRSLDFILSAGCHLGWASRGADSGIQFGRQVCLWVLLGSTPRKESKGGKTGQRGKLSCHADPWTPPLTLQEDEKLGGGPSDLSLVQLPREGVMTLQPRQSPRGYGSGTPSPFWR